MDDDAFANNIYIGTGADFPKIGCQFDATCAVLADSDIADVSESGELQSPFCVKIAIPLTLLSLVELIVATACFADGAERIPVCYCMLSQLMKTNEMLINSRSWIMKLFFILSPLLKFINL